MTLSTRNPTKIVLQLTACAVLLCAAFAGASPSAHAAPHHFNALYEESNPTFVWNCAGWVYDVDSAGYPYAWTGSNGSTNCAQVDWTTTNGPSTSQNCTFYLWVPSSNADATVYPGVFDTSGHKYYGQPVNEAPYSDQWIYFGTFSYIKLVNIGDNNGQFGTTIGIGRQIWSLNVSC